MAAYNGGPGKVYSAIKKSGSKNFWNLQFYLPEESRTYVKRFIATHYIMEGTGGVTTSGNVGSSTDNTPLGSNHQAGNLNRNVKTKESDLSAEELLAVEFLSISGKYNSLIIAKNIAMDIALFNRYNPNFDDTLSSSGNFNLRLPSDKMQLFITKKYPILNESLQALLNSTSIPVEKK